MPCSRGNVHRKFVVGKQSPEHPHGALVTRLSLIHMGEKYRLRARRIQWFHRLLLLLAIYQRI